MIYIKPSFGSLVSEQNAPVERIMLPMYHSELWVCLPRFRCHFPCKENTNLSRYDSKLKPHTWYITLEHTQIKYAFCEILRFMNYCTFRGGFLFEWWRTPLTFQGSPMLPATLLWKSNRYLRAQQQFAVALNLLRADLDRYSLEMNRYCSEIDRFGSLSGWYANN